MYFFVRVVFDGGPCGIGSVFTHSLQAAQDGAIHAREPLSWVMLGRGRSMSRIGGCFLYFEPLGRILPKNLPKEFEGCISRGGKERLVACLTGKWYAYRAPTLSW